MTGSLIVLISYYKWRAQLNPTEMTRTRGDIKVNEVEWRVEVV